MRPCVMRAPSHNRFLFVRALGLISLPTVPAHAELGFKWTTAYDAIGLGDSFGNAITVGADRKMGLRGRRQMLRLTVTFSLAGSPTMAMSISPVIAVVTATSLGTPLQ